MNYQIRGNQMEEKKTIKINVTGETCPVPLVETRKAIRKAEAGDIIEIVGNHPPSKDEIPMAVESLGLELISVEQKDDKWKITIKIPGDADG